LSCDSAAAAATSSPSTPLSGISFPVDWQ